MPSCSRKKRYNFTSSIKILIPFPIIVFFESFFCTYSNAFAMTYRAFVEILSHLLPYLLWLKPNRLNWFPAFTTKERYITTLRIEIVFSFLSKWWNIDEVCITSTHGTNFIKNSLFCKREWKIIGTLRGQLLLVVYQKHTKEYQYLSIQSGLVYEA